MTREQAYYICPNINKKPHLPLSYTAHFHTPQGRPLCTWWRSAATTTCTCRPVRDRIRVRILKLIRRMLRLHVPLLLQLCIALSPSPLIINGFLSNQISFPSVRLSSLQEDRERQKGVKTVWPRQQTNRRQTRFAWF